MEINGSLIINEQQCLLRGLHLDLARRPLQINTILNIIKRMNICNLNTLHLHLTDDQGIAINSTILNFNEGLTFEDQILIKQTCDQNNIEIIPEIDIPGHTIALRSIL